MYEIPCVMMEGVRMPELRFCKTTFDLSTAPLRQEASFGFGASDLAVMLRDGGMALAGYEDEFVALRENRDAQLAARELLLPSIQVNIRAGRWPHAELNGARLLRIPPKLAPELDKVVWAFTAARCAR